MKESDAKVDFPQHQMLVYVEKPDGSYGSLQTGSWMSQNYLDDHMAKQRYFHETYLEGIRKGEISPIAYYMNIMELAAPEAAVRVGLSARAVRRHMTGAGFASVKFKHLLRYAELFGVPVAKLFTITNPFDRSLALDFQATAVPGVTALQISARPQ